MSQNRCVSNYRTRIQTVAVAVIAGFSLFASRANATVIDVDFNTSAPSATYTGTGAAPDAGTTWNGVAIGTTAFTSGALVDSLSNSTSVLVSLDTAHGQFNNTTSGFAPALLDDYAYNTTSATGTPTNGRPTFTISGLTNSGVYDLYLYSQNGVSNSQSTTFIVNAISQTVTPVAGDTSGFVLNGNYTLYSGVVASGTGTITGSYFGTLANPAGAFNGLQIVSAAPVPEPSSIAFLSLGALTLLRRRRTV